MAINSVLQTIRNAEIDARSLSEFVFNPADAMVSRRLAPSIHTLNYYLRFFDGAVSSATADAEEIKEQLISAQQQAQGTVSYIENTIRDAIDTTVIENSPVSDALVSVDGSLSQRTVNKGLESIADLSTIKNPKDGLRVYVKSYHAGLNKGGGYFTYDSLKADINDGGLVVNGWVREFDDSITPHFYGAVGDGVTDDTQSFANALSSGLPVYGSSDMTYLIDRIVVTSNVSSTYPNYKSVNSNTKVYFDGRGCKIKSKPYFEGDSLPYPLNSPVSALPFILQFADISDVHLANFSLQGALFDNLEKDSEAYVIGVQGTRRSANTFTSGINITRCGEVSIDNLDVYEFYLGLHFVSIDGIAISNTKARRLTDAFTFSLCDNGIINNCYHEDARVLLCEARNGEAAVPNTVIDRQGSVLYKVLDTPKPTEGIHISGGHGFVVAGCTNMHFYNCGGLNARSDCFRVQQSGSESKPSEEIYTYNYTSRNASRYVFSIYPKATKIYHISPTILDYGVPLRPYQQPPSDRTEALKGCTSGDYLDFWSVNLPIMYENVSPVLCRYGSMYIRDLQCKMSSLDVRDGVDRFLQTSFYRVRTSFAECMANSDVLEDKPELKVSNSSINMVSFNKDVYDTIIYAQSYTGAETRWSVEFDNCDISIDSSISSTQIPARACISYSGLHDIAFSGGRIYCDSNIILHRASVGGSPKIWFKGVFIDAPIMYIASSYYMANDSSTLSLYNVSTSGQMLIERDTANKVSNVSVFNGIDVAYLPFENFHVDFTDVIQRDNLGYKYLFRISDATFIKLKAPRNIYFKDIRFSSTNGEQIISDSQVEWARRNMSVPSELPSSLNLLCTVYDKQVGSEGAVELFRVYGKITENLDDNFCQLELKTNNPASSNIVNLTIATPIGS